MRRFRVLTSALATLLPLFVFVLSLAVLIASLVSGSLSYIALAGIALAVVWAASGRWRTPARGVHHG